MMKLPPGYKVADHGIDHALGYACPYEMELDDMFEAFETLNRGVVGGAQTVDDYTPDGLSDKAQDGSLNKAMY